MPRFSNLINPSPARIDNLGTARMSVAFALDVSSSITREQLQNIQDNVNAFSGIVCENEAAASGVDVCVYTFADTVTEIVPWCSIRDMPSVELVQGALTDLNGGALAAAKAIRQRSADYASLGLIEKKPYLIIMSDGCDTVTHSVQSAAEYIVPRERDGKLKTFFLGYGAYDRRAAAQLTEGNGSIVFEVRGPNCPFDEFFDFVGNSVKVASVSAPGADIQVNTTVNQEDSAIQVNLLDTFLNS